MCSGSCICVYAAFVCFPCKFSEIGSYRAYSSLFLLDWLNSGAPGTPLSLMTSIGLSDKRLRLIFCMGEGKWNVRQGRMCLYLHSHFTGP